MKQANFLRRALAAAALLLSAQAALWAADFSDDGIYYNILSDNEAEVTAAGGRSSYSGDIVIPASVTYGGTDYEVTVIGESAFASSSITSIQLPETIVSIESHAFERATKIQTIDIPASVSFIADTAFDYCSSLEAINVAEESEYFRSASGVLMSERATRLICYPAGKSDESYQVPEQVDSIDEGAFESASHLKEISLPSTMIYIGEYAFYDCSSLQSISIPEGVKDIFYETFGRCSKLKSIQLPDGLLSIGSLAFDCCLSLESIEIPETVAELGVNCFYSCTSLTSVRLPNALTAIPYRLFRECSSLEEVVIPKGVTSIGIEPFYDTGGVVRIHSLNPTPPAAVSTSFTDVDAASCQLILPIGCKEAYASDQYWSVFTDTKEGLYTSEASDVASSSATLTGTAYLSDAVTDQGFEWADNESLTGAETVSGTVDDNGVMTASATGLSGLTDYYYRAYAVTSAGTIYADEIVGFATIEGPSVTTIEASDITDSSAILNGLVIAGADEISDRGFEYWTTGSDDVKTVSAQADAEGYMAYAIDGLTSAAGYSFRAWASTANETVRGETMSFTLDAPTVTTSAAYVNSSTSVTLKGHVSGNGITAQGFQYWIGEEISDISEVSSSEIDSDGYFAYDLDGLSQGTAYYYRAMVSIGEDTFYGEPTEFETHTPATVVTMEASDLTTTSAVLSGMAETGTIAIDSTGFQYSTSSNMSYPEPTTVNAQADAEGYFSASISSLTVDDEYFYRAFATAGSETFYGEVLSFKPSLAVPDVTTSSAENITSQSATLKGHAAQGEETITSQGFQYWIEEDLDNATEISCDPADAEGNLSAEVTGLQGNTEYYFRSWVVTSSGTYYGEPEGFATKAAPTVTTNPVEELGDSWALLTATIVEGDEEITGQGFEYWSTDDDTVTIDGLQGEDGVISYRAESLTPATEYSYRAFAETEAGIVRGETLTFTTEHRATEFDLYDADDITVSSAKVTAVIVPGSEEITDQGFQYWSTEDHETVTLSLETDQEGKITATLASLTADTRYEYCAFVKTESGTDRSDIKTFLTELPPTLQINEATEITYDGAVISGAIVEGSQEITSQGFEYWKEEGDTIAVADNVVVDGSDISLTLESLIPETEYSFRVFAEAGDSVYYSETATFLTAVKPATLQIVDVTDIDYNSAAVSGTIVKGSQTIDSMGFEYWTEGGEPVSVTDVDSDEASEDEIKISATLSDLAAGTHYNVRVFVEAGDSVYYSETVIFTTEHVDPIVEADEASNVTASSAYISGTIYVGTRGITSKGYKYWKDGEDEDEAEPVTEETNPDETVDEEIIISATLTGLESGTKYNFCFIAIEAETSETYASETKSFTTVTPPTVTTGEAGDITSSSATLSATIQKGSEEISDQGFKYATSAEDLEDAEPLTAELGEDGSMTLEITGLEIGTKYFFTAYAVTETGTQTGEVASFTTAVVAPTLEANAAENVLSSTATVSGTIIEGSEDIITQGFEYWADGESTLTAEVSPDGEGKIAADLSELTPLTEYSYCVFAATADSTYRSEALTFTTVSPVTTDADVEDLTYCSATVGGWIDIANTGIDDYGFKYSTVELWDEAEPIEAEIDEEGNISATITGLMASTEYVFKAYVVIDGETYYGDGHSFTTSDAVIISSILFEEGSTSATLNGQPAQGIAATSIGFLYGESSDIDSATEVTDIYVNRDKTGMIGTLSGLTVGTTYYVWAYVEIGEETYYSEMLSFVAGNSQTTYIGAPGYALPSAEEIARYDLNGRRLSKPQRGVNIVVYSDGTVEKIVVKE